jgi:hypothetical protein
MKVALLTSAEAGSRFWKATFLACMALNVAFLNFRGRR